MIEESEILREDVEWNKPKVKLGHGLPPKTVGIIVERQTEASILRQIFEGTTFKGIRLL